jgi:hypothetical protein
MNSRQIQRALTAADPLGREQRREVARLDFEAMEADLLADAEDEPAAPPEFEPRRIHHPPPRLALAGVALAVAAAIAVVILLAGGGSERSSRAYGAELIRFAESTPLLLLEGPGWRVQDVSEYKAREGTDGFMEFVTGKPVPYGSTGRIVKVEDGQVFYGVQPAAVRQRKVELRWRPLGQEDLATAIENRRKLLPGRHEHLTRMPVLETTAFVDTRAETLGNQGGPGDREMLATWSEGGNLLELQAAVPDQASFEERLDWLTKVDSQAWLEAMPAKVVKAADFEGTVREMLKGIPVPKTFSVSRIPDEGLTTSHDQVAGKVTNTVACLWFRQWGAARANGDGAAKAEAERAMRTYRRWPILRQEKRESGEYPETLVKLVASMPSGVWQFGPHRYRLLPKAEGLGCARLGIPVLPWKQQRQRERGVPPPPD